MNTLLYLPWHARSVQRRCIATAAKAHRAERHSSLLPETWIVSSNRILPDYPATSIAQLLELPIETKYTVPQPTRPLIRSLSSLRSRLFNVSSFDSQSAAGSITMGDFPRFAIASCNQALPGLLEIKKRSKGRTMAIYLGLPNTKLKNIDAMVLSRLDQMKLRSLGPARANLDNAISTLLPLCGLSSAPPIDMLKPRVAVCIGTGFESMGFQLKSDDVDRLAEGLLQLSLPNITIVLNDQPYRGLKPMLESRLISKLCQRTVSADGTENLPADVKVVDCLQPDQPSLASILESSSHVIATADNIPVVSMAAAMSRPVYIAGMERTTGLLRDYYHILDTRNLVRRFYPLGSRYSYMLMPEISGKVDEFSAIRDHDPWACYDARQDLRQAVAFIKNRFAEINK
ncbi:hypothetical protein IWW36_002108 [Coemansia brasiliensis]|uniref:Uncharacterized protein n=1 Tax=Coemansia brasiliensis TaxID=2650707 RepID=A0A9W8I7V0_9FUNG|nr:hypothetical protein IWW36_002108 [Coemansia brasiliensis]